MRIKTPEFGKIIVDGKEYTSDIVILPGKIIKRKKQISKEKHGTSHKFSQEELETYLGKVDPLGIDLLVVGTGQYGRLSLLPGAREVLEKKGIKLVELKTPEATQYYQKENRNSTIGIFHITC